MCGCAGLKAKQTMTENGLKQVVLQLAIQNGWAHHHNPQERITHKAGNPGFPDLVLARDKKVLFIELKAQDGRLSSEQEQWLIALPAAHVIRPKDWESGRVHELLA